MWTIHTQKRLEFSGGLSVIRSFVCLSELGSSPLDLISISRWQPYCSEVHTLLSHTIFLKTRIKLIGVVSNSSGYIFTH